MFTIIIAIDPSDPVWHATVFMKILSSPRRAVLGKIAAHEDGFALYVDIDEEAGRARWAFSGESVAEIGRKMESVFASLVESSMASLFCSADAPMVDFPPKF